MGLEYAANEASCWFLVIGLFITIAVIFLSILEERYGTALLAVVVLFCLSVVTYTSGCFDKASIVNKNERYKKYVEEFGMIPNNIEHFQHLCSCCVCGTKTKKEELDNE